MTLGLAGFIANGDDRQTWEEAVEAVVTAVATEFAVIRERSGEPATALGADDPAGAHRLTWLDTFDWRLHKAGLALEYVAGRRGGELRLMSATSATTTPALTAPARTAPPRTAAPSATGVTAVTATDGDTSAVQPVHGWTATRPHLSSDLPDGPVVTRIAGLIAPRALLPVAAAASTTTVYRLLNTDDKTVARLFVERLVIPGGDVIPLAPRLTIVEVRGYQGQARRAARLVAAVPGIGTAAEAPFPAALRALGRRPGDYSNKVDAPITAAMPAPQAAAAILLRLLDTIETNVGGVLKDTDTEFLHDLRVSVRRTRSALKLFGDVLTTPAPSKASNTNSAYSANKSEKSDKSNAKRPDKTGESATADPDSAGLTKEDLAFFAAEFKWIGDVTTPTRDLDVHLLDFAQMADGLAAGKPDDLEPFRTFLEQRRRKEFRALTRALRSPRFTGAIKKWRAELAAIRRSHQGGAPGAAVRSGQSVQGPPEVDAVGTLAAERTRVSFVRVARRGAAITAGSPPESLHDLRKRCKELRYALEFFAPLHDQAAYGKVVGDLKRLQDCLGEFQDTEVQIGEIRALAAAMLAAGEAPAVTLLAMGEVTAGLVVRQHAARADFERRFAAFADVDGQRRMSALLRGRQGGAGRYQ